VCSSDLFAAREKLGEDWLESYLKAPIWRFALMPGALDARPWFGVLMPSVDRVGRQFPLTFAASFAPAPDALHRWWSALIVVALRAKEPDCDADALEVALLASSGNADRDPPLGAFQSRVAPTLAAAAAGTSLWWSMRHEAQPDETVSMLEGLPRGNRFVQLIAPGSST